MDEKVHVEQVELTPGVDVSELCFTILGEFGGFWPFEDEDVVGHFKAHFGNIKSVIIGNKGVFT
jgi:hypothetical protein